MYESYWQLRQKPFENNADPQFYFPGEPHQAALLKLRYAIESRRGGALLAGASGTGKTLVTTMLRTMLGETYSPFVRLVYPQMTTAELLAYLADELDGSPPTGSKVNESVRRIEHFLVQNVEKGNHAVVVIDEAHLVESSHTLETLRLLLNFGPNGQPALTLLLAGQPGILPVIDRTPQLEERLGVKCLLRPFTVQETGDYVAHRLRAAGATRAIIEPSAIATLHALTHGIARQINRLCDLALLIGFAEEQRTLSAAHFEAVCNELVAVVPE
jgi:general secretion pathway protein A